MSWFIAWNQNLRYGGIATPVSRAWASFFVKLFALFGVVLPKWMNNYKYGYFDLSVIAPLMILVCCMIQNRGSKRAA